MIRRVCCRHTGSFAVSGTTSHAYVACQTDSILEFLSDVAINPTVEFLISTRGFGGRCVSAVAHGKVKGGDPMSNSHVGSVATLCVQVGRGVGR